MNSKNGGELHRATEFGRRVLLKNSIIVAIAGVLSGRTLAAQLSSPSSTQEITIENFSAVGISEGTARVAKIEKTDAEWQSQLSTLAYKVTRHEGTEAPYSGKYWNNHAEGLYRCICCETALFDAKTKFESGTGWPSFWKPISPLNVAKSADASLGMQRDAIACSRCNAHLGHVFGDGPKPTGLRYCMNSVALSFVAHS